MESIEIKIIGDVNKEKLFHAFEAIFEFLETNFMMYQNNKGLSAAQKITVSKKRLFKKSIKLYDIFTCSTKDGFKIDFKQ